MKLLIIWPLILSLTLVSCGSDNDDNDSSPTTTNQPAPPQNEEEEEDPEIRYNSIELFKTGMTDDDYRIRADLNRRPLIITSNFVKRVINDDGSEEVETCNFIVEPTDSQADRIEAYADKLRVCKHTPNTDDEVIIDGEFNMITLVSRDGSSITAEKTFLADDVEHSYLCKGRANFYSYVKKVMRPKVPTNCPTAAMKFIFDDVYEE